MRIAIVWTMVIVIFSFLPGEVKEAIGTETRSPIAAVRHRAEVKHRIGHLIGFGIASLLFTAASRKSLAKLCFVPFVSSLGSAIEYLQHVLFGSVFEWWDIRDDMLAVMAGFLVSHLINAWLRTNCYSNSDKSLIAEK